jgi:hypothetical protein
MSEVLSNVDEAPAPVIEETAAPTPTDSGEVSEPTPGAEEQKNVPVAALIDERRKRQEASEKLRELESRFEAMQRQIQAKATPEPEWTEESIMSDLPGALKTVEQRVEKRLRELTYSISESQARKQYADYDEAIAEFAQLAKQNPMLSREIDADGAPAFAAYAIVKRERERREASDPKKVEAKVQAEVNRRVEEELAKLRGTLDAQRIPPSVSSARGQGSLSDATWSPPSMSDILKLR